MKEDRKDKNNEELFNNRPGSQPSGDIDDFIFADEGHRCSEK